LFQDSSLPRHSHSFPPRRSSDLEHGYHVPRSGACAVAELAPSSGRLPRTHEFPVRERHLDSPTHGTVEAGRRAAGPGTQPHAGLDRKSTRLNSSHVKISYAVFFL